MSQTKLHNTDIATHLGQKSKYASLYDPTLLVKETRAANRKLLNIQDDNLPFIGIDEWVAFEVSGLLDNGAPFAAIAKWVYPCNNKHIVESKSAKLYLNSFNQTKCGKDIETAIKYLQDTISADLSTLLDVLVTVDVYQSRYCRCGSVNIECSSINIDHMIHESDELVDTQSDDPTLLKSTTDECKWACDGVVYSSELLKSNCKITSQPDWGTLVFTGKWVEGNRPSLESITRYIASVRNTDRFHEECCEKMFHYIYNTFKPYELAVGAYYTRRGGIDIRPFRATSYSYLQKIYPRYDGIDIVRTSRQ